MGIFRHMTTSAYVRKSSSETLHFPKLNGTNYYVWSDNIKAALQARLLWLFVEGLEDCPPVPPTTYPLDSEDKPFVTTSAQYRNWITSKKEYLDWLRSDSAVMGLMRGAIKFGQREHIQDATTSKDMWDRLQTIHVTQWQGINVHYYYQELYTKKWGEHTTMSDPFFNFAVILLNLVKNLKTFILSILFFSRFLILASGML